MTFTCLISPYKCSNHPATCRVWVWTNSLSIVIRVLRHLQQKCDCFSLIIETRCGNNDDETAAAVLWVIVCHGELIVNHWDHDMLVTALSRRDWAPSEVTPSHRQFSVWQTADTLLDSSWGRSKLPSCGTVIDSESRYPLYYATISSITGPNNIFNSCPIKNITYKSW